MRLIDEVRMVVALDPKDNTEGVCAVLIGNNWMPLIAADPARFDWIREQAIMLKDSGAHGGAPIRIIKLTKRKVVEEIG